MLFQREGKGVSEVIDRIGVGVSLKQYDGMRERMTMKRERERENQRGS